MYKQKKLKNQKYKTSKILIFYYKCKKQLKDNVNKVYNDIYFQFSVNSIIFVAIIFFIILFNPTEEVLQCNQNLKCSITKEYIYIFKNQKLFNISPNAKLSIIENIIRPYPINIKGRRNPYINGSAEIFYKAKITESNIDKQIFTKPICFCYDYQKENCI